MHVIVQVLDAGAALSAIVVAIYAILTVHEMKEQRKEALKPVLFAFGQANLRTDSTKLVIAIRNIGTGPAFDIRASLSHPRLDTMTASIPRADIGVADTLELTYSLLIDKKGNDPLSGIGAIRIEYGDIYGRRWESVTSLRLTFSQIIDEPLGSGLESGERSSSWRVTLEDFGSPRVRSIVL